ncbi:MAG: MotA/TolQ/ExbB proton channel family protein [Verrucomicrobiota bacterium]
MGITIFAVSGLNLFDLFQRGGYFMWPLLICSVLAVAGVLDRLFFFFFRQRYRMSGVLAGAKNAFEADKGSASLSENRDPVSRIAAVYFDNLDQTTEHRRNVIQREAGFHLGLAERRIRLLSTVAALSPLIGLLGTVWGMVEAFASIETLEQVKPADVAGGIWSALLTTVFGLVVAIPAVAVTRWAEARIEKLGRDMNLIVSHLDDWTGRTTQL